MSANITGKIYETIRFFSEVINSIESVRESSNMSPKEALEAISGIIKTTSFIVKGYYYKLKDTEEHVDELEVIVACLDYLDRFISQNKEFYKDPYGLNEERLKTALQFIDDESLIIRNLFREYVP